MQRDPLGFMLKLLPRKVLKPLFLQRMFEPSSPTVDELPPPDLLKILSDLSEIPLCYTEKAKALKRITELCRQAMGSHACTLALIDLEKDILTYGVASGSNVELENFMSRAQIKIGHGYSIDRDLIAAGNVVERYNLPSSGGGIARSEIAGRYNLQSGLCYPLKSEDRLLGYISHFSAKSDKFTETEKSLLKIFADQSVNVIERFDHYQARDRLAHILQSLSARLLSLSLPDFLQRVAEGACQLLNVPVGIVWMLDANTDTLKIAAASNVDEDYKAIQLTKKQFSQWTHLFNGEVERLTDVRKKPRLYCHSKEAGERGWVSLLSAPLRINEELIGMLNVYTKDTPRQFLEWEQEIFLAFANSAATTIQTARLQERKIVADIWETIEGIDDRGFKESTLEKQLDTTLNRIVEQCVIAVRARTCHLRLFNRTTERLDIRAWHDRDPQEQASVPGRSLRLGEGIAGKVAQDGKARIVPNTHDDGDYADAHAGQKPISVVCVPIKSGKMVIGTLSVGSDNMGDFGIGEQQLLESIGARISVTIERAQLMDSLRQLAEIATQANSIKELLSLIVTLARDLTREPICLAWWLNKDCNGFAPQSLAVPSFQETDVRRLFIPNSTKNFSQFLEKKRPTYIPDAANERLHPYKDDTKVLGWKSGLSMALTVQGKPLGFLEVYSLGEIRECTNWHRQLFKTFVEQASLALGNVASRIQLKQLNQIISQMVECRKVEDVLTELQQGGLSFAKCPKGWVSQLDHTTGERTILKYSGPQPKSLRLQPGEGITGKALQEGQPQRAGNVHDETWREWYRRQWDDTISELAIPIIASNAAVRIGNQVRHGGTVPIGVLSLESPIFDAFSQEEEELLWMLAREAASIIQRIELDGKLSSLTAFQREVLSLRNWDEALNLAIQRIMETLGFEYVKIGFFDREQKHLIVERESPGSINNANSSRRKVAFPINDETPLAKTIRSGETFVPPYNEAHGDTLKIFVPMISPNDNRLLGVVEAGYAKSYRQHIYERDAQILRGFVDYTVRALEHEEQGILDRVFHELKAPIVGIKNTTSVLERHWQTLSEDAVQRKLSDILIDCDILLHQTWQLQHAFGRHPAITKRQRTTVMRDIVIKTINQLRPFVREHKLEPSLMRYHNEDIAKIDIYVDREKLNQVVYNLLINAIKYAKDDPAEFNITATVDETVEDFVIKFRDWGIGIATGCEEKIFERGFRTPEARHKNVAGSGLGLTIARELAREIGGDLRLARRTEPTEFNLILPKTLQEPSNGGEDTKVNNPLRR